MTVAGSALVFAFLFHLVPSTLGDASWFYADYPTIVRFGPGDANITEELFQNAHFEPDVSYILELYAHWCPHCVHYSPEFKRFVESVKNWSYRLKIGGIDCAGGLDYSMICSQFSGVKGYPTVLLFNSTDRLERNVDVLPVRDRGQQGLRDAVVKSLPYDGRTISQPNEVDVLIENSKPKPIILIQKFDLVGASEDGEKGQSEGKTTDGKKGKDKNKKKDEDKKDEKKSTPQKTALELAKELHLDLHPHLTVAFTPLPTLGDTLMRNSDTPTNNSHHVFGFANDEWSVYEGADDIDRIREWAAKHLVGDPSILEGHNGDHVDVKAEKKKKIAIFRGEIEEAIGTERPPLRMDYQATVWTFLKEVVVAKAPISFSRPTFTHSNDSLSDDYSEFGSAGDALLELVALMRDTLPLGNSQLGNLTSLHSWLSKYIGKKIEVDEYSQFISTIGPDEIPRFYSCEGTHPMYRGFPCGLWSMFHHMTIFHNHYESVVVLRAMRKFAFHFFQCEDCRRHFLEGTRGLDKKAMSDDEAIIYLWKFHNQVNMRTKGSTSEDPAFPKGMFPNDELCPTCRNEYDEYNEAQVLPFLEAFYTVKVTSGYIEVDGGAGTNPIHVMVFGFAAVMVLVAFFAFRTGERKKDRYTMTLA